MTATHNPITEASLDERLLPHHLDMLRTGSGLPDGIIEERGYWSARTAKELRDLGFTPSQALAPALIIPLRDGRGEMKGYAARPDQPRQQRDGRVAKYELPRGARPILDVPVRCRADLGDPTVTLYVTEGAKKVDRLAAEGVCALSLNGVWNWRGTNDRGGKTALADWEDIALNGRLVRLVFDSDVVVKDSVAKALLRLKLFLERRGARVEVLYLPDREDGAKQGIDDYLAAGHSLAEAETFLRGEVTAVPEVKDDGLPEIVVNDRYLAEIVDDCWRVLVARNEPRPIVFCRAGRLVSIVKLDDGEVSLRDWSEEDVVFVLERFARFVKLVTSDFGTAVLPDRLPADVVKDILVAWEKPVPQLTGIVRTPVFAGDATLVTTPGYQPTTFLYYAPDGEPVPPVPARPSPADLAAALGWLHEWLADFPFASASGYAHILAAVLTVVARELIAGPVPLIAIDAPNQGTGKGLLAQTAGVLIGGGPPAVMTEVRDGDEERKRITSLLREGPAMVLLDNVKYRLASPVLAAVLTSERWKDRLLGKSETLTLPNRALWMATGNNIQVDGEIARRTVMIRLDSRVDRPWEREGFRHADLLGWVRGNRHRLVWSLLVLVQHWIAAGRQAWEGQPMGSFESWTRTVGGVLTTAGIPGFLADRDAFYREADSETEEWRVFVHVWWETYGTRPVKAADLLVLVRREGLLPGMTEGIRGEPTDHALSSRLGKALTRRRDQRIGDHFLRCLGHDSHQKGQVYRLESAELAEHHDPLQDEAPQDKWSTADSPAGHAELAEGYSFPRARVVDRDVHGRVRDRAHIEGEGALQAPHAPQGPQTDSDRGDSAAELSAELAEGGGVPRCRSCGTELSVVAVSDRCGRCGLAEARR